MQLAMCKTGIGPINLDDKRNPEMWILKRAFFTAYGKMWGMKCQGVFIPNGLLAISILLPLHKMTKVSLTFLDFFRRKFERRKKS